MKTTEGLVRIKITSTGILTTNAKSMPSTPVSDPKNALDFLFSDRELPSAAIFRSFAANPLMIKLQEKKLTYREMVIVSSGVIGALDAEIQRLRRYERSAIQRLFDEVSGPLIRLPKPKSGGGDEPPNEEYSSNDEAHWFLQYLSLRNILAVLVVVISLATAFFSFVNKDYRSLLKMKDEMVATVQKEKKDLETQKAQLTKQLSERDKKARDLEADFAGLRGELIKFETKNESLIKQLDESNAARLADGGDIAQQMVAKDKQIKELNDQKADLTGRLATAEAQSVSLLKTNQQLDAAFEEQLRELHNERTKLSEVKVQLNDAVLCWNDLIGYLYAKDRHQQINLETHLVKQKLKKMEGRTGAIPTMKSTLQ